MSEKIQKKKAEEEEVSEKPSKENFRRGSANFS